MSTLDADIEPHRRWVHLLAFAALCIIAVDAFDSPASRPTIIDERIWFALYSLAAVSVMVFIVCGTLTALQVMTVLVTSVGMFRGVTFFLADQRLTPLGLNLLIFSYASLAHRYERRWAT